MAVLPRRCTLRDERCARSGSGGRCCSGNVLTWPRPACTTRPSAACRYFLRKLRSVKKANGQVLSVNEVSGGYLIRHTAVVIWLSSGQTAANPALVFQITAAWNALVWVPLLRGS